MAMSAAMAAAIQPMIGMFIIAMPTARQAETAAVRNAPNEALAIPAKVAEVAPPVTNDSTKAPSPFKAWKRPTVAKTHHGYRGTGDIDDETVGNHLPGRKLAVMNAICMPAARA